MQASGLSPLGLYNCLVFGAELMPALPAAIFYQRLIYKQDQKLVITGIQPDCRKEWKNKRVNLLNEIVYQAAGLLSGELVDGA